MANIVESATRLFDLMDSRDTGFTRCLKPGLSAEAIERTVAPIGVPLPPEVFDFYRHFDLPKEYDRKWERPAFYGIYEMPGLDEAVGLWQTRRAYDFLEAREKSWFPFLQEDGNAYLIDTTPDAAGNYPVLHAFHAVEPQVQFASLTAMFDTFFDWVHEGVLPIESGHIVGDYAGDPARVAEIARRHNPGVAYWMESARDRP